MLLHHWLVPLIQKLGCLVHTAVDLQENGNIMQITQSDKGSRVRHCTIAQDGGMLQRQPKPYNGMLQAFNTRLRALKVTLTPREGSSKTTGSKVRLTFQWSRVSLPWMMK